MLMCKLQLSAMVPTIHCGTNHKVNAIIHLEKVFLLICHSLCDASLDTSIARKNPL